MCVWFVVCLSRGRVDDVQRVSVEAAADAVAGAGLGFGRVTSEKARLEEYPPRVSLVRGVLVLACQMRASMAV